MGRRQQDDYTGVIMWALAGGAMILFLAVVSAIYIMGWKAFILCGAVGVLAIAALVLVRRAIKNFFDH